MQLLETILKTTSKSKDNKRREFILYVLLLSSLFILFTALAINTIKLLFQPSLSNGFGPLIITLFTSLFLLSFGISKKGHLNVAAWIFLLTCFFPTVYMTISWGVDLPQALLLYALITIMTGILVNSKASFYVSGLISVVFFATHYLNIFGKINIDTLWKHAQLGIGDIIVFSITIIIVAVISWLSNKEMEKSLRRARASEAALKKERDLLEIKVEERTEELKKAQIEKMTQLYRFAEFGRLSSGIFHDLINPMTVVSLNLEKLKDMQQKEVTSARTHLSQAFAATKRMEDFIISIRKQLQKEKVKSNFSITEEIIQSIQMLSYRARKSNVEILFSPLTKNIQIFGDSVRFSQIVMNLISNAIDSYDNIEQEDKKVEVQLIKNVTTIHLIVKDSGCGIEKENLNKIFNPFFTTKSGSADKGMGIGLSSTKNIIENDFQGIINITSEVNQGTVFDIEFKV